MISPSQPTMLSRRTFMLIKVCSMLVNGRRVSIFEAKEAVATSALAHPSWDMDEQKTWHAWEEEAARGGRL